MPSARVLWVAAPNCRPEGLESVRLLEASTQSAAVEAMGSLSDAGQHLDAVVASPALPDGDGGAVLRSVRDRWPDAACFLYGNLWAIPEGSALPVCEFHPAGQSPSAVADAVSEAVTDRYHRPYPVHEEEQRRLRVLDAVDFEAVEADLQELVADAEVDAGADFAVVSAVDDYTVWFVAASDPLKRTALPRGEAACTYTIDGPDTLVIEDVEADERLAHVDCFCTRDNRSYAAHPLRVDGVPVGVLAVMCEEPGAFSAPGPSSLVDHADGAERVLESTL